MSVWFLSSLLLIVFSLSLNEPQTNAALMFYYKKNDPIELNVLTWQQNHHLTVVCNYPYILCQCKLSDGISLSHTHTHTHTHTHNSGSYSFYKTLLKFVLLKVSKYLSNITQEGVLYWVSSLVWCGHRHEAAGLCWGTTFNSRWIHIWSSSEIFFIRCDR